MSAFNPNASAQDAWRQAFPFDEAKRAAELMVQTWNKVVKLQPKFFASSKREAELTERLHYYVNAFSLPEGRLLGFWINENPAIRIDDATGEVIDRVRKDITYCSNNGNFRLELIFEFKKLKDTSASRTAYIKQEGMQRFVDRRYGKDQVVAAMVGIVVGDEQACIEKLKGSLCNKEIATGLKIVPASCGNSFHDPSRLFPAIAIFDTEHQRFDDQGKQYDNIQIAHLFLPF